MMTKHFQPGTTSEMSRPLAGMLAALLLILAPSASAETATKAAGTPRRAAILSLKGPISDVTVDSLRRRMDLARERGAEIIVFDMDTPGGLVTSSIAIADLIKGAEGVTTVAWVNPNAHSGGTIVAVACNEIVMARSSRIGDSQVIMGGPTGVAPIPEELRPKAETPVLTEFRASAKLRGYDRNLCEAFVRPEREVWWLENTETGEREFVFGDEKRARIPENEGRATDSADTDSAGTGSAGTDSAGTGTADEPDADTDADIEGGPTGEPAESAGKGKWRLVTSYYDILLGEDIEASQPVVRDDQLLEMSAAEAHAYGFSKGVVNGEDALKARYGIDELIRFDRTWSESFTLWLTSPFVRGFLLVVILLGAYVEFHTPGVGVAGLVALIGLAIFVVAPYLSGLANIWEIIVVILGIILLLVEVFVLPGFGIAGLSGIVLVLIGLLATFVPDEPGKLPLYIPSLKSSIDALKTGIATMVTAMGAALLGMVALSRVLPKTAVFKAIAPENPTPAELAPDDVYLGAARVGDRGIAQSPLRPAGKALFGRVVVDVVTQGEYIEDGSEIEVVQRRANYVVVRAAGAART